MSISIAAARAVPLEWILWALGTMVLGVIVAVVMRRGSVAGPSRIAPSADALRTLAGVTFVGVIVWLLIPGMFAAAIQLSPAPQPATEPATPVTTPPSPAPAPVFSPRQAVMISIVGGVGGIAAILLASAMFRPGGLRELGFSLDALRRGVGRGTGAALLVVPVTFIAAVLTDKLWERVGLDHPGAHEMLRTLAETPAPGLRALIYVSAILVAPLFEELLFRGHIQTLLVGTFAAASSAPGASGPASPSMRWLAIVVTSILFTLVHGALWMMPPIFILSLCLGYVYERTGNLWAAIIVHLVFNLTNVVLFVTVGNH